jgi:hypothetical protein
MLFWWMAAAIFFAGKGGEDREIEEKDWARKDGKQWVGKGYSFDYKNEKDRPRDW